MHSPLQIAECPILLRFLRKYGSLDPAAFAAAVGSSKPATVRASKRRLTCRGDTKRKTCSVDNVKRNTM